MARLPLPVSLPNGEQRTFLIDDVGPELNAEFVRFYEAQFARGVFDLGNMFRCVGDYLNARPDDAQAHDAYFHNFHPLWAALCNERRFEDAGEIWAIALAPVLPWERATGRQVHKGSPFYWLGGMRLLAGDLDTGFMLVHRAVNEDARTNPTGYQTKPAWRFATIDDRQPDQYWGPIVVAVATFLREHLARYRQRIGGSLTEEELRQRFFARAELREAVFWFAYSLFRAQKHSVLHVRDDAPEFVALLLINTLTGLYLTLESLLRTAFSSSSTLHGLVTTLSTRCGFGAHASDPVARRARIEIVRADYDRDPAGTVNAILDGSYQATTLTPLDACLVLAPSLRNHGAHRFDNLPDVARRFDDMLQLALDPIFVATEHVL